MKVACFAAASIQSLYIWLKRRNAPRFSQEFKMAAAFEVSQMYNKSMDVRAKQRLSYQHSLVTFGVLSSGFAPRHLSRSAFRGFTQPPETQEENLKMRSKMSRESSIRFLSLVVGFLMLFCSIVGKAQSSSAVNLTDTVWDNDKNPIRKINVSDNSETEIVYFLGFSKQGKAKINIIYDKSAGATEKYKYEYVTNNNGTTEYKQVRKLSRTLPSVRDEIFEGTFQVKGKIVYLDFPSFTIEAIVAANSIDGVLNHKDTNKDEPIRLTRTASQKNTSQNFSSSKEATSPDKINAVISQKVLPQRIIDKFNPIKLSSSTISGNLADGESEKYFYFTAVPGELTVTLSVTSDARSLFNTVMVNLYDPSENIPYSDAGRLLDFVSTGANYGRTETSANKFKFSEKMPVLIQLKTRNNGTARFTIKLEGAYEIQ